MSEGREKHYYFLDKGKRIAVFGRKLYSLFYIFIKKYAGQSVKIWQIITNEYFF